MGRRSSAAGCQSRARRRTALGQLCKLAASRLTRSASAQGISAMKKLLGLLVLVIAAVALYLAATPSPIEPLAWQAPPAPAMTGMLEPNDTLMKAELLGLG